MRPVLEHISLNEGGSSLKIFTVDDLIFKSFWHFHPQLELTYIISGEGMRYVGDSIETFGAGDLVLVGKNTPHNWESFDNFSGKAEALVVQFSGDLFSPYSEFQSFQDFIKSAKKGLHFKDPGPALLNRIIQLRNSENALKLIKFLEIFYMIQKEPSRSLSSTAFNVQKLNNRETRINRVKNYINNQITEPISLTETATYMKMTESYFCRWFKKNTGKTLVNYINRLRVEMVCRDLKLTDKNISEIAYEKGFENISHFNRVFKSIKSVSPRDYRCGNF